MPRLPRPSGPALFVLIGMLVTVAACGDVTPSASRAPGSASGSSPSAPEATPPPVGAFWSIAGRAMAATARLRVIAVGRSPNELRFEPRASASLADGELATVCVDGRAYEIDGFAAAPRPARWTCGFAAFVSSYRRSGQPLEAWNNSVAEDSTVRERVVVAGPDRWRWEYTGVSSELGGRVRATLVMDALTGRMVSGTRTDPTGDVRWTFNYTALFTPVQLP